MALASLFDDFPVFRYENGSPRRRRQPARPLLYSVLDSLEDQIGQKFEQVFRILPRLTMELDDGYENGGVGKKRKLRSGAVANYEPKSKVMVSDKKDNKFKITLDTSNYQPEEITVKVVNDKLAISAKHEAKEKDVYEFYEMYRSFDLPENVDPNAIKSHLNAAGQLTIEAPLKALPEPKERSIPVEIDGKEQPEPIEIDGKEQPETVEIDGKEQPEPVEIDGKEQPEPVEIEDKKQPETVESEGKEQPETVEIEDKKQPETVESEGKDQPEPVEPPVETSEAASTKENNSE